MPQELPLNDEMPGNEMLSSHTYTDRQIEFQIQ